MSLIVGDFVKCLAEDATGGVDTKTLYTVAEIWPDAMYDGCAAHGDHCTGIGVTLKEVSLDDECFCSERFKLVYRPNDDLIKNLMKPLERRFHAIQVKSTKEPQ